MPPFDKEISFAFLFGVAKYDDTSFASMPWVENNLREVKSILVDEDLIGFLDDTRHTRVCLNPAYGQIGGALDTLRREQSDIDTLFVYYCGHGVIQGGKYFITGQNSGASEAEKLWFGTFEAIFLRIKARRKILILDSCFSGRAIEHLSDTTAILGANVERLAENEQKAAEIEDRRKGVYVVASAGRDEPAQSRDGRKGAKELTAFTSVLVGRIRLGLEEPTEGRLTISEVFGKVITEAVQLGLPEPVTSDKMGLGAWRLIGNAVALEQTRQVGDTIIEEVMRRVGDAIEGRRGSRLRTVAIISGLFSVVAIALSVYTFLVTRDDAINAAICKVAREARVDVDLKYQAFAKTPKNPGDGVPLRSALLAAENSLTREQAGVIHQCLPNLELPGNSEKTSVRITAAT